MCKCIVWSSRRQSERRRNRSFELLRIAECANQTMMRFQMFGVSGNRFAKRLCRVQCIPTGQQVNAPQRKLIRVQQAARLLVRQNWLRRSDHLFIVTSVGEGNAIPSTR